MLLLGGAESDLVSFLDVDGQSRTIGPIDISWPEASQRLHGRRPSVLVSGLEVSAHTVKLPNVRAARLHSILPYAMEELVAADIETLHFAYGPGTGPGDRCVLVVARDRMQFWLEKLAEHEIVPVSVGVDYLSLPFRERFWSVLGLPGCVLLRAQRNWGVAVDTATLDAVLRLALQQAGDNKPEGIVCLETQVDDVFEAVKGCVDDIPLIRQGPKQAGMRHLFAESRGGVDLRQGPFAPQNPWLDTWRRWRVVGVILVAWIVLEAGLDIAATVSLRNERDRLNTRIEQVFHETFPDARNLVNPRAQMQHRLDKLRRDAGARFGFFQLLEAGAQAFARSKVEVRQLNYRNRQLDVEVGASSLSDVDALRNVAASPEITLSVLSAASRNGKVTGRIRLMQSRDDG